MDKEEGNSKLFLIGGVVVLLLIIVGAVIWLNSDNSKIEKPATQEIPSEEEEISDVISGGCDKLGLAVNSQQAYSCFDKVNSLVKVYVSRSSENVNLKRLDFSIYSTNNSVNFSSTYGLAPGAFYIYQIDYSLDKVDKIEIKPTVQKDGGEESCSSVYVNYLQDCAVGGFISAEPEPEYYLDENLNVILSNETSGASNLSNASSGSSISAGVSSVFASKPQKKILNFSISSIAGEIDDVRHRVFVKFTDNRSLKYLIPSIAVSENATIVPLSNVGKDFTNPVIYTVTASDNSTQQYTVYVSNYIEEIAVIPEQNISLVNLTNYLENESNLLDYDCSDGSCSINFSDVSFENETFISDNNTLVAPSNVIVTNLSGAVAGTWSTNLSAASQIAQMNKKFYIINYGNLQSCSYCVQAEKNIFNKSEFKQWAYNNGIAMIYANSNYDTLDPAKTVRQRYVNPLLQSGTSIGFPFIILVGYENTNAVASFTYRKGYNINGIRANLTVTDFIKIVDSYTGKYNSSAANSPPLQSIVSTYFVNYSSSINWVVTGDSSNYSKKAISASGSEAGQWTRDLNASKALAKSNNRFYIVSFTASSGCAYCNDAKMLIFDKSPFIKWASENGIPLVYADTLGSPNYVYPEPTRTILSKYLSGSVNLPTILVIDGSGDGTKLIGKFVLRQQSWGGFGELTPQHFADKIKSVVQGYSPPVSTIASTPSISTQSSSTQNISYTINWTVPRVGGRGAETTNADIAKSGAVGGEWSRDISAVRDLAKQNNVFYILNFGRTSGCALCSQADLAVYSSNSFKQWVKQNKIPLLYVDYSVECERHYASNGDYLGCTQSPLLKEIHDLYFKGQSVVFPTVVIVDGNDGKSKITSFHMSEGIRNFILVPFTTAGLAVSIRSYVEKSILTNYSSTKTFTSNRFNIDWSVDNIYATQGGLLVNSGISLLSGKPLVVIRNNQTMNISVIGNFSSKEVIPGRWASNIIGALDLAKTNSKFMILYLDSGSTDLTLNRLVLNQPSFLLWANKNSVPISYRFFSESLEKDLNKSRTNYNYASNPSSQGYNLANAALYNATIQNLEYIKSLYSSGENVTTPTIFIINGENGSVLAKFDYKEGSVFNGITSYPNVKRFTEVIHSYVG